MCGHGSLINYFPVEVIEHVFHYITSNSDRNAVSLVCKTWYEVERLSRVRVLIPNCYSINPSSLISRFPNLTSLSLKANIPAPHWGAHVYPWIHSLAASSSSSSIHLEELRLKRMHVSDDSLRLLARSFPNFKSLVLIACEGFSTDGIAAIASHCRFLRELDLQEMEVEDNRGQWLSCFPDTCTSLVSLNFACLKGAVNLAHLERLVARCPNLRCLRVNSLVPLEALRKILVHAPCRLVDLGAGSLFLNPHSESEMYKKLKDALHKYTSVRSFSGFLTVSFFCLPAFYPVCSNLTSLNLRYVSGIRNNEFIKLISHCTKLERLWILDTIEDKGLGVVASTCKQLKELRVFHPVPIEVGNVVGLTEQGLVAISAGCPKLNSMTYVSQQMTNAALVTVAKNSPNLIRFRLCTLNPTIPDAVTLKPLDEGFGAIVQSCKGLKRLSLSGLLSDQVFLYIGMYGEQLEMLSVAFAGDSDKGMIYVLNGCKRLKKLEIRNSPFGNAALLADMGKYETMRSLWMSSCQLTLGACKTLAKNMPRLNVEIIRDKRGEQQVEGNSDETQKVEKMYLYRTLVGPRKDAPDFVWTL